MTLTPAVVRAEVRLRRDAKRIARGATVTHGLRAYQYLNCRCDVCRAAKAEANRRYRRSQP